MHASFQRGVNRSCFLAIVIFLFLPASLVRAESITIEGNDALLHFPNSIMFVVSAKSQAAIDHVTLIYGTSADFLCASNSARQEISYTPSVSISLVWTWDLKLSDILPPGTVVWWQWELHDASGATTLTDVKKLNVEDPALIWKKVQQGNVTVFWEDGDASFGNFILNETTTSLVKLAASNAIQYSGSVRMMVYPSSKEVLDAAPRLPDWIGGVTFPEYGTVMIGVGPQELDWARAVIPHELAHLVTSRQIFNCQGIELPTWLSEGLAVFAEGPIRYRDKELVMQGLKQKDLTALVLLKQGFSPDAHLAAQDYAESGMVVAYLMNTFGSQKMDKVLGLYKDGALLDDAFLQVFGLDTQGIDDTWRASLGYAPAATKIPPAAISTPTPFVIPTLALWTAEVPQATNTAAPPTARPSLTATRTQPAPTITKTAVCTTEPAKPVSSLSGATVGISLVAALGLLTGLFFILRGRMRKGG